MPVEYRIVSVGLGANAPSHEPVEQTTRLLCFLKDGNQALDQLRRALERDEAFIRDAEADRATPLS